MNVQPNPWNPREQWDALVSGVGCPLCDVLSEAEDDAEGFFVAELSCGRLRLGRNQFVRGYCVLVCHSHVREAHLLPVERQRAFFEDLMRASRAVEAVFAPIKLNLLSLGNVVPHLHVHLVPRYPDDPAPGAPLSPGDGFEELSDAEAQAQVQALRRALG